LPVKRLGVFIALSFVWCAQLGQAEPSMRSTVVVRL
jgi:hypothetical protein